MAVRLFVREREAEGFKVAFDRVELHSEEPTQWIDLTDLIRERVIRSGVVDGLVNIQTLHTTTAVVVNEDEPLLHEDILGLLEQWAPRHAPYRHNKARPAAQDVQVEERPNGHAHARSVVLGTSSSLNIVDGRLQLGRWQRIFLLELDGPRPRTVSILVLGIRGQNGDHRPASMRSAVHRSPNPLGLDEP